MNNIFFKKKKLRQANGEVTHHDAFGTAEPWVNTMYEDHLSSGSRAVLNVLIDGIQELVKII
jgi:hypothetical protein